MTVFKGTIYASARMFVEQRYGSEAVELLLSQMPAADSELLRQVTPIGWYPVEPVLDFHRAIDRRFGTGNLDLCVEVGRFSAGWALNTVLKMFVKLEGPQRLIERSGSAWSRYHDSGRWTFDVPQPRRVTAKLYDFAVRDEAFCARFRGWLKGAIELSGGQRITVAERACCARGHAHHEFVCSWD